ncbi:GtrA family protein [Patescibacteria group bacterium]|nr:GtrA family protein [Patescibacteria group bacterium]
MRKLIDIIRQIFGLIDKFLGNISFIHNRLYLRQFVKFAVAGTIATFVDFFIYIFLTRFFLFWESHIFWANFTSMTLAGIMSFVLNKKLVFNDGNSKTLSQYIKFLIISGLGGMAVYQFIFFYSVDYFHFYDLIGKIFAVAISLFYRFLSQKFWIFTTNNHDN